MSPNLLRAERFSESRQLPHLLPTLQHWIETLHKYREVTGGNQPWTYGERPHTSLLAAAAWASGAVAMEEWRTEKRATTARSNGRLDLRITTGSQGGDFHIEAKHHWFSLTQNQRTAEARILRIKEALAEAAKCAQCLTCRPDSRVAMLFVTPCLDPADRYRHLETDFSETLTTCISEICKIPHAAIAWYLPHRTNLQPRNTPWALGSILLAVRPKAPHAKKPTQ